MDYRKTLNLPQTKFPMRANLPQREPEILQKWEKEGDYQQARKKRMGKKKFILHDGPPYANGDIHMGTALNKVLKDIVNRYNFMQGYDTPYVPGWDTHGLPIEHAAIKQLGIDRSKVSTVELRRQCAKYAYKYIDKQRQQFRRLGVRGDWADPYLTLKPAYEAKQIEVFGEMAKRGYIYKGLKPVYWCYTCETALAEAEVEYGDKTSDSIYVKFPVADDPTGKLDNLGLPVYFVIWTTTTWTLPANVAIALHPNVEYSLVKHGNEVLIMARELVRHVQEETGLDDGEIIASYKGDELAGIRCAHPFIDRESIIILADYVTLDQGTGCVHTATGHGMEDYQSGLKYGLDIINPVDTKGYFTKEAGPFAGLHINEASKPIRQRLEADGYLLGFGKITHQYPHCWRCKEPVIFRATEQWFASVEAFRDQALAAISKVRWIPAWGEDRIHNMVKDRSDWCISRQRVWGVPIPIFYCTECGQEIITDETIKAVRDLFYCEGSNAWFEKSAAEILPASIACSKCGAQEFTKETDTMDVWFDSGSSHMAVLEERPELEWPCDLYLEGSDQHRGWFQSSLLTAVAVKGEAPYRAVLTHGYVVDGEGKKMSKSVGNVIYPEEIINKYGADILRLWVASSDFKADIRVSTDILNQMSEVYRKIRNTCRFLLGNLYDFDPAQDSVPYNQLTELDRWALGRLARLVERVNKAYESYEYHLLYHTLHNFCAIDMSAIYLDIIKDRIYCLPALSLERRGAQTVMYQVITALVRIMAPVLAYTAEEIWSYLPEAGAQEPSVHFSAWPELPEEYNDAELLAKWEKMLAVRSEVARALERIRQEGIIGQSLEAKVELFAQGEIYQLLTDHKEQLADLFIVSQVDLQLWEDVLPDAAAKVEGIDGLAVIVRRIEGAKCERCWKFGADVGQHGEHEALCPRCAKVMAEIQ